MRIVILTLNQIYASRLVKDLIKSFQKDIKLIIEPSRQIKRRSNLQALFHYLKISGLDYVVAQTVKLQLFRLYSLLFSHFSSDLDHKFYTYRLLAKKLGIKNANVANINSLKARRLLKAQRPDLIVSVLFSQILSAETIKIARLGVINIHPAYLPDYKGVSPVFWTLVNGEKYAGVSVHFIDEGIDTGEILKRKKVPIKKQDTEDSLYWRLVQIGSPLLISVIKSLRAGRPKVVANQGGRYFSFPTKEAVKKFRKKGRLFFKLNEYLRTDSQSN